MIELIHGYGMRVLQLHDEHLIPLDETEIRIAPNWYINLFATRADPQYFRRRLQTGIVLEQMGAIQLAGPAIFSPDSDLNRARVKVTSLKATRSLVLP